MRIIITLVFIFLAITSGFANRTYVSSASDINNANWSPGDTIVMTNGTWEDQKISLRAFGTLENPIVLMAETAGSVILTGNSSLGFSGEYVTVEGLYFKDGDTGNSHVISFRTSYSNRANNCRLTNCAIKNYNPANNTVDNKWVSLYGENNQVDHCSFENKNNSGTLLVVWLHSDRQPNHVIKDNYFGYRKSNLDSNGKELNGQEIIRIGDSSHSMQTANVTVSGNFFEHCNGEIEIISNKSGENHYSNNIFYECKGMLTLRHGNNCTVEGNYFFGNDVSNSGGVRVIGENHVVFNNYFENLGGNNYRSAICLVRGRENSPLNGYFQVKNTLVAFNTIVNCRQSFSVNYNSSSSYNQPPIGSTIAHNHVYNETSVNKISVIVNTNYDDDLDVTWKNNFINNGAIYNLDYTDEEIKKDVDAKMTIISTTPNMYEPSAESGLLAYTTTEYEDISEDIRGRQRADNKLPGVSQIEGTVTRNIPQRDSVGASFFQISTAVKTIKRPDLFKAYTSRNVLVTDASVAGNLVVYDLNGRLMYSTLIEKGISRNSLSLNGIYLVGLITDRGERTVKKLVFNSL